jgi:AIR synthase-related protein
LKESLLRDEEKLRHLISFLAESRAVREKLTISQAYAPAAPLASPVRVGDDCAAIPDGEGWLLLAAEGMMESFVAEDPWFAGYSAVMVNLSDIAAMGGRALAVVDVLGASDARQGAEVWAGLAAASRAYGVPIVGGHTSQTRDGACFLTAAVLGRADGPLLTSFDARPGEDLLMAVDLRGGWWGDKPFWNASTEAPPERLRHDLRLLPTVAQRGWSRAAKDISNGGIVGTLAMLLECSKVGAELWLDRLPQPPEADDLRRWLLAFPSYGYLLSAAPENSARVTAFFQENGIACAVVGRITASLSLVLGCGAARADFPWRPGSPPDATSP